MQTNLKKEKINVFYKGKKVGVLIFIKKDGTFESDAPRDVLDIINSVRGRVIKEGIREFGDMISKEPIKVSEKYLIATIWRELGKKGIELRILE